MFDLMLRFSQAYSKDVRETARLTDAERQSGMNVRVHVERLLTGLSVDELTSFRRFIEPLPLSRAAADIFFASIDLEIAARDFDCRACGVCCRTGGQVYLLSVERDALPEVLTEVRGDRTFMRRKPDGDCVAYEQSAGCSTCGVYASRPIACVTFTPGNPKCLELRLGQSKLVSA